MRKLFKVVALGAVVASTVANITWSQEGIDDPQREPFYSSLADKRVVFLPLSMGFDLTETWAAIMAKQAEHLGYDFDIRDPNWSTDAGAQALTQIITEKPDLIVVHNPDIQVYARLIQRAQKEGIYVLQVNMRSAYASEGYVGPDWIEVGELLAKTAVAKCSPANGGSGKIAITQGPLTAPASAYQIRGVFNILEQNPDIEVVSNQAADWDASKARAVTATALQQNEDLCAVIGFWDGQDIGIAAAVEEAGRQGEVSVITSGAGTSTACENISAGKFTDYINYNSKGQGRDLNNLIAELLQTRPEVGKTKISLYSPLTLTTAENLKPDSCYRLDDLK